MASLSSNYANCTTEIRAISKLAEGKLNPTILVVDEVVEEHRPQDQPPEDTIQQQPPRRLGVTAHNPLAVIIQPVL